MFELTPVELQRLGTLFINTIKKKLEERIYPYGWPEKGRGNKIASGQLYNSLTATVVQDEQGQYQLAITYMDYFKYVNRGRRPGVGLVPIPALLEWIKVRGIKARNKKGQFIPSLSLAFAIRRNIFQYGIRRTDIYDKAYDNFEDMLSNPPPQFQDAYESLYNAIGQDVENFIDYTIRTELMSIPQE